MIFLTLALVAAAASANEFNQTPLGTPEIAGLMSDSRLIELSGLAPSRRHTDTLWGINDGGQDPIVWRLNLQGKVTGQTTIAGVQNIDFEDLASFRLNGKTYLAVGDIGDNAAVNNLHQIYVILEPGKKTAQVSPSWTIRYQYPDGAHDGESLMIDVKAGLAYVVSKRVDPPVLYSVPLQPGKPDEVVTATKIGGLQGLPAPPQDVSMEEGKAVNQTRYASQPTGAVMGCNHREFYLLTYAALYRYQRSRDQSWQDALINQVPQRTQLPPIFQAEAVTMSENCQKLYVGSEKVPSVLWRYTVQKHD